VTERLFDGLPAEEYVKRNLASGFATTYHGFYRWPVERQAKYIKNALILFKEVFKDDGQNRKNAQ